MKRTTKVKCPRHGFGLIAYIIPCIYVLYVFVCECVLSFVPFSPDHFNPCVGGHCFCSSLPHSLSCSPALSLSLSCDPLLSFICFTLVLGLVFFVLSLSLCACSYLLAATCPTVCRCPVRSFVRSFSLPPRHCRRQTVWRVGVVHVGCAHCIYTGCIHYVHIMAHT